jgi:hypothetical protein
VVERISKIKCEFAAVLAISCVFLLCACKGGAPRNPVSVQVVFYNHTQGLLGEKTYDGVSGGRFTLVISELGFANVDPIRIAVRKSASRETMGELVQFSKTGSATVEFPNADATFEAYLMNSGSDYQIIDTYGSQLSSRSIYWDRKDWALTGPDEPIEEAIRQLNQALEYQWKRYGVYIRQASGLRVEVGYDNVVIPPFDYPAWVYWSSDPYPRVVVNPQLCPTFQSRLRYFITCLFMYPNSNFRFNLPGTTLHQIITHDVTGDLNGVGRDLFAYVFVKAEL